jgi:hypothetical protein
MARSAVAWSTANLIDAERLEVVPWAPYCLKRQKLLGGLTAEDADALTARSTPS